MTIGYDASGRYHVPQHEGRVPTVAEAKAECSRFRRNPEDEAPPIKVAESCGSCADTDCAAMLPPEIRSTAPPCAQHEKAEARRSCTCETADDKQPAEDNPFPRVLYEMLDAAAKVESCPECGAVTDIDYDVITDEVRVPDEWPAPVNPLHAHMRKTFDACLAISKAKNASYAGDADPLANFKTAESLGVPVTLGIAVRMSDKWARLTRLLKTGENPLPSESITDTLQDLVNYAAILLYALECEE